MKRIGILLAATLLLTTTIWAGTTSPPASVSSRIPAAWQKAMSAHQNTPARRPRASSLASRRQHPAPGSKAAHWKASAYSNAPLTTPITLTVTNTNDAGPGSLRDAVSQANANPGSTIRFSLPSYPATLTLTSGELAIDSDVTIVGPGADKLSIDGNDDYRIFDVGEATATISGLYLQDAWTEGDGGAIYNAGILTLEDCEIDNCQADNGGAIANNYELTVRECAFIYNYAEQGGAIEDFGTSLTLINSSFFFNETAYDGGAMSLDGEACTMTNVTIAGNYSHDGDGGGVWGDGTEAYLLNTVVAYNSADNGEGEDWYGGFYSEGHNLIDYVEDIEHIDGPATADQYDVDPMLSYPLPNGGTTLTAMPLPDSPLIDAGDDSVLGPPLDLTTDQRGPGFPRKLGAHVDIGACEFEPFLTFMDDSLSLDGPPTGTSAVACVGTSTGGFEWIVVGADGPATFYSGRLEVYNGGTMFWSQPGASQYVYIYYDPNGHTAWGYLYDYTTGLYSSLYDSDTLNDPPICQGLE